MNLQKSVHLTPNAEKQLTLLENLKELKHLVTGMGPEGTEIPTGGLADYFTTDQLKLITDYTYTRFEPFVKLRSVLRVVGRKHESTQIHLFLL